MIHDGTEGLKSAHPVVIALLLHVVAFDHFRDQGRDYPLFAETLGYNTDFRHTHLADGSCCVGHVLEEQAFETPLENLDSKF